MRLERAPVRLADITALSRQAGLDLPSSVVVIRDSLPWCCVAYTIKRLLGAKLGRSSAVVSVIAVTVPVASSMTCSLNAPPMRGDIRQETSVGTPGWAICCSYR